MRLTAGAPLIMNCCHAALVAALLAVPHVPRQHRLLAGPQPVTCSRLGRPCTPSHRATGPWERFLNPRRRAYRLYLNLEATVQSVGCCMCTKDPNSFELIR